MSTGLHLTTEEFDRMVECGAFDHLQRKIELIRGEIREMNPAGPLHDGLIAYINSWSARVTVPEVTLVTSQTGLSLPEQLSKPEPDVMWLNAGRYLKRHPTGVDVQLAVEVSHSSLKSDLVEKSELYAEAGIREYWIVDANSSCIHVFRQPQGSEYTDRSIAKPGEFLSPVVCSEAKLDVADLFTSE
ncbi:Uma2 family endonuclease [Fuerstiella marisgermanici]|uniref:Putative restriction endonuclease domain-containing protein n=1 Tax=Fuerstiella marisgermanici TaxID=1891926 RepID=A0A1P8WNM9_9PLAN|nr:Uma2 family endonuclease [Fuerstiella marisgermanici]APZ95657.1 hypothetical protein Fuma_05316 [Fuerstiella marisgermanici]